MLTIALPGQLLARVDAVATARFESRPANICTLIEGGLEAFNQAEHFRTELQNCRQVVVLR